MDFLGQRGCHKLKLEWEGLFDAAGGKIKATGETR